MALMTMGHGGVQVGIGKDDLRALAAQLQRHRAVALGRHLLDDRAHLGAAGEADVVNARVARQRVAHLVAVAGDDVDGAGGKPTSAASCATRISDRQASSAGLTTHTLPAASAPPTLRPKICIG
jgi:hypothetical protein